MTEERVSGLPVELPRVALSLVKLALVGFSLVLFAQMTWLQATQRTAFALHNVLGIEPRKVLLLAIASGMVLPAVVTLTLLWLRRTRLALVDALERAATFCAPLAVLFLVPGLFLSQVAEAKPLFYLVVLVAFGISFSLLMSKALEVAPRLDWLPRWYLLTENRSLRVLPFLLLLVGAVSYALVLGRYSIAHHRLLQTSAADVGIVDNVMANLLHGHFFRAPAAFGTQPGDYSSLHGEYGSVLFVPIYWLRPGAETLLLLQVVAATLTVIPLYLLVAARLGRRMALWFGAVYLLLAPLHAALLLGFSWLPVVSLLSITLYYAVDSRRRWLLLGSLVVLLSISEAGALNVLFFGMFLIVSRKRVRLGIGLAILSGILVLFNLVHSTRGVGAADHPPLVSAVQAFLGNPVYFALDLVRATKLTSVLHALAPFCLLPLFELAAWPLFVPALLFTSATTEFWPAAHLGYGSGIIWIPACLLGLLFTLEKQRCSAGSRNAYRAWVVSLSIVLLSHSFAFGALLRAGGFGYQATSASFRMTPADEARYGQVTALGGRIPALASVTATSSLFSHVSNRPDAYQLSSAPSQPDYIFLSKHEATDAKTQLERAFATRAYRLVASSADDFYLFSRAAENAETIGALKKLGFADRK